MILKMTIAELEKLVRDEFPQIAGKVRICELADGFIKIEMLTDRRHLRPGGTLSGPTLFTAADLAVYFLVLAFAGPKILAVTTSCSIDFMRKPQPGTITARAKLLKLGKRLAVGDVLLYSENMDSAMARATLTYSLP